MAKMIVNYNMDLLIKYFPELIQCVATAYLAFAVFVALVKTPGTENYRPYRRSKRLLVTAYLVISVNLFAWLAAFDDDWTRLSPYTEVIDTLMFFLAGVLLSFSFGNLLDSKFLTRRRVGLILSLWFFASLMGMGSLVPAFSGVAFWMRGASVLAFVVFAVYFVCILLRLYHSRDNMLDKYFTNDMHQFVRWIYRSILLVILLGVVSVLTLCIGVVGNWICQVYIIATICYIAVSFVNYSPKYGVIARATSEIDSDEHISGDSVQSAGESVQADVDTGGSAGASSGADLELTPAEKRIEEHIKIWKEARLYALEQFTINDLALTLGTNRSTLSHYINRCYGMNFSTWVSTMRIEEAKRLIVENPGESLENIASRSGFSSLSYFSKVFSRFEGVAPTVWRNNMTANIRQAE